MSNKLSVFGLGYVGTVSAVCLAARGHQVTGVDVNVSKVDLINERRSPIVEAGVEGLVRDAVSAGRLRASANVAEAIAGTDSSIVCVGTPTAPSGRLNSDALLSVAHEIGRGIRAKSSRHTVIFRSTMLPGTFRGLLLPALEASSGKQAGRDFGACVNPEFLREGSAIADFNNPQKTVIGADRTETADAVAALYADLPGAMVRTTPEIAELAKYVDNVWHALKVGFANEIGNICKAADIDSHAVMDLLCLDRKLNISPAYLRPGFAFGGSCLPKDTRGLGFFAREHDLNLPILQSILPSNAAQIDRACEWVLSFGKRRIALLGCAFKAGTDDIRESPFVILLERLLGKGCQPRVFDENVKLSMLTGANRAYLLSVVPHITNLLVESAAAAIGDAEVIILANASPAYVDVLKGLRDDQVLLDFSGVEELRSLTNYGGLNW
jgi:GDP-mannose 6-dehydrogenase